MNQKTAKMIAWGAFALVIVLGECWPAQARDPKDSIRAWLRLINT